MRRTAVLYFILALGFSLSAESIAISGKVTNQSGKAISGAKVTLKSKNLSATTNPDGSYSIVGTALNTPSPVLPDAENITMNNGIISISLPAAAPVRIELFDMKGNLLEKVINRTESAGNYRFNISADPFAVKMTAVRISVGHKSATFRYIPVDNGNRVAASYGFRASEGGRLAKMQAVVDSLKVTASNYTAAAVAISSYQTTVDITLDSIKVTTNLDKFSFFVTSMKALQDLSKSQKGFGGDFRFGKTGAGAGLLGADSICSCIAERSMPGSSVKQWRAFLSVSKGPDGTQVNAIDRIGTGPWYDRVGRVLSNNITELLNTRPAGANSAIKNDLPNEDGVPNHRPDGKTAVDNHHMITGSGTNGKLSGNTCNDWTSLTGTGKGPNCGFSWPRGGMGKTAQGGSASHWIYGFTAGGCGAGIEITDNGMGSGGAIVGSGGGYGGFYCFALNP